jgi:hypothetical protein
MGEARNASHRRRPLELRLVRGSIVSADARALVLGVFSNVDPSGAAGAVDAALGGAIHEFTLRRMFSGQLGQVFVLPCARSGLHAEFVLFAGLGDFDAFGAEAHAFVAENVARTLVRSRVEDFATVLFGAGSGVTVAAAFERQFGGFLTGLRHADPQGTVRRITWCEIDARKHAALVRAAHRRARTLAGDDFDLVLDEVAQPTVPPAPTLRPPAAARSGRRNVDPAYLLVSMRAASRADYECRSSLLTAGAKAAVLSGTASFARADLQRAVAPLDVGSATQRDLPRIGGQLARLLLASSVREGLAAMAARPLVVVHDREASRVPWEVLHVGGEHPALARGLTRRYESDTLTVARWQESPPSNGGLRTLLVANPTGDLPGAADEALALRRLFGTNGVSFDVLEGPAATRAHILRQLAAGQYDVLHFAGHAFFDVDDPGRGGLLCAGEEVLRGADLASLVHLPALVFCNACEAARVRRPRAGQARRSSDRSASIAEAFLAGGVANFIGTHWPVGDAAALEFSSRLYREWLAGTCLGDAVLSARRAVLHSGSVDWADYVHYGNREFVLPGKSVTQVDRAVALRPKTAKLPHLWSPKRPP